MWHRADMRFRRAGAITLVLALLVACGAAAIAIADPDDFSSGGKPVAHAASASSRAAHARGDPSRSHRTNIYSHTRPGMLTPVTRRAKYLVYVPDSQGNGVYVIDPRRFKVIRYFATGPEVQHVVPAWDLRRLYATNDVGNSLTPIDPDTGQRAGPN